MRVKKARLGINKAGGTAGKNSIRYRVDLPAAWIKELNLNKTFRNIKLEFDGETITIKNNKEENEMKKQELEKKYAKAIEILTEVGSLPVEAIDNLGEFIDELKALGYIVELDASTDYLELVEIRRNEETEQKFKSGK